ncbi:hypothetical protein CAPTEDRAFT_225207 [Capitella teleta]|uniref:Uncharacterized protein n=1 Tax=Capitella teleta TaxID=283909 RepID=R7TM17_CAPTE|nr:hypothetical protein CAPTEDRAFT_225207 [Capitella teleta]|eukprot:ELT94853.1 hypothetical protein CAPTEDRAFT_225207 [Capitella teleta]
MADDFETFCDKSRQNLTEAQEDWRNIIKKYDRVFDKSDEIDLNTLTIVEDRGHINDASFPFREFGKCSLGKHKMKGKKVTDEGNLSSGASNQSGPEKAAACADLDMTIASILTADNGPRMPISDAETLSSDDSSSSSHIFSDDCSSSSLSEDSEDQNEKCKMPKIETPVESSASDEPKEKFIHQWINRVKDWMPQSPSSRYSSLDTQDPKDDDLSKDQEKVIDFLVSGEQSVGSPPGTPLHGQVKQMFDDIKRSVKKRTSPPPPACVDCQSSESDSNDDVVQRSFDNLWHSQFDSLSINSATKSRSNVCQQSLKSDKKAHQIKQPKLPLEKSENHVKKQRSLFPDHEKPHLCSPKSQTNAKPTTVRRIQSTHISSPTLPPPALAPPALPKILRAVSSPGSNYLPLPVKDTHISSSSEDDYDPSPPANKSWFHNSWKTLHSKLTPKSKEYQHIPTKSPRTGKVPDRSLAISQSEESESEQGTLLNASSVCGGKGKCDQTFCFECLSD